MATFRSTLSDVQKDKLNALRLFMEYLETAEYIKSYKLAADDKYTMLLADEGIEEYFRQLEK
ncbi:MAG: CopG family transcriptional regulator [Cytophagales bacterium]|jgi:hypothetical protein|nr:CopG family transcriptional regulator [Cytophagales bacterium]MCA6368325.1 CopG family transcriptional regulator [Cytophagales bacterium]MCA6372667.1 CopG family transcriptional regulator [Cytophagales bacterium]MCA6376258.1 CopG family transcriptional regulator [Cytophagales bacterium]MCA6385299.1 CopG family transcriptional regulator [Cytophagales bacterium]